MASQIEFQRIATLTVVALSFCLAFSSGCLLVGREKPVSKQVATSRQLSQKGISALDRGEWDNGETLLAQSVKACPADPEPRRHYAEALWHRGARDRGLAEMREARRLSGEDPALTVRLGEMCFALGRMNEADALADEAIDVSPRLATAWALRGQVAQATGRLDDALSCYHRGIEYQRDDRSLLYLTAEIYRQQGRPERALSMLEALRDSYPAGEEPQHVLYLQGLAFVALTRYDDAAESLTLALGRETPSAELYCRLAEAQLLAGRTPEANAAVQQALALDPHHEPSRLVGQRIELASHSLTTIRR